MINTTVVEFDLDIKKGAATSVSLLEGPKPRKSIFSGIWARKPINSESWKWALFERRKLEQVLRKFQKWTAKLKRLVTLTFTVHPRYNDPSSLARLVKSEDASRLGLAPHARIRQLTIQPSEDKTVFDLGACELETKELQPSGITAARLRSPTHAQAVSEDALVEFKEYSQSDDSPSAETEGMVHQLASLLASAGDNKLQTLGFRGYIRQKAAKRYAFIFNFPEGSRLEKPASLYSLLSAESSTKRLSLPQRFRVAQTMAQSIGAFHGDGWVHKSFRSESIMFFRKVDDSQQESYNQPYLVDFEFSRPESAGTQYTFDDVLERKLYRHPDRQGPPTVKFSKIHDVYALGVVLLEIGLWQTVISLYRDATLRLKQGVVMSPRGIQNVLIEIARRRLPHHMGPAYLDAVVVCLSGKFGDATSAEFPMVFQDRVVAQIDIKRLQSWREQVCYNQIPNSSKAA